MTDFIAGAAPQDMPEDLRRPRVLVVDDDRITVDTLVFILNKNGFDARGVYSGEAALELAPEFMPRIIVCDVNMGGMNGIDTAIRMRSLLPGIKILLMSGQAATADRLEQARAQGYEFEILAKPVHPQDLLKGLRG